MQRDKKSDKGFKTHVYFYEISTTHLVKKNREKPLVLRVMRAKHENQNLRSSNLSRINLYTRKLPLREGFEEN